MLARYVCIISLFFPILTFANITQKDRELPLPKLSALPRPSFKHLELTRTKSEPVLPAPLKSKNKLKYVLGAYGSYNYFRDKDIETSYVRFNTNISDSIKVNERLEGFSPVGIAGIQIPLNIDSIKILDSIYIGIKAFNFKNTLKGQMAIFGLDDYVCDDTVAKVPLRSTAVMLNSRLYFKTPISGLMPFIEGGLGINYYKTKLTVTGDEFQFDTRIKNHSNQESIYNLGAGLSQEIDEGLSIEIAYNYYHSPELSSDIRAKSGLNLASPIKIKYDINNVSLGFKKELLD